MKDQPRTRKSQRRRNEPQQSVKFSYYSGAGKKPELGGSRSGSGLRPSGSHLRLITVFVVISLLIVAIFSLPAGGTPKIVNSSSAGGAVLSSAEISEIGSYAKQLMDESILNRTKLSFKKSTITSKLVQRFPVVQSAEVNFNFFGGMPTFDLHSRAPDLIVLAAGSYYAVDGNGRPFEKISLPGAKSMKLPILKIAGTEGVDIGKKLIPSNYVSFIAGLNYQIKHSGRTITDLALAAGDEELDAVVTGQKYLIKFNILGDARQQAGEYLAARSYLEKNQITPGYYLDVRVEGKAYFK